MCTSLFFYDLTTVDLIRAVLAVGEVVAHEWDVDTVVILAQELAHETRRRQGGRYTGDNTLLKERNSWQLNIDQEQNNFTVYFKYI